MTAEKVLDQIRDRRGTLKALLAQPCPLGREMCPLAEWRARDDVGRMRDELVTTLLLKHLECPL
jgi:hypothetical protein